MESHSVVLEREYTRTNKFVNRETMQHIHTYVASSEKKVALTLDLSIQCDVN